MDAIKFQITKKETIRDVQDNFSKFFPYLRINFFKNSNGNKKAGAGSILFCQEVTLQQINPAFSRGEFEITDSTTVNELESKFYKDFGFSVQVLRKSGNLWIGTSISSDWTLKQQNDLGKEISPEPHNPIYFKDVPYGC